MNAEDLTLYARVRVRDGGMLTHAQLVLGETNFIPATQGQPLNFGMLHSGQEQTIEIPIRFAGASNGLLNLDLLDMVSRIRLVGTYINNEGNEEVIDATREVRVVWNASNITESNHPMRLDSGLITNEVININGTYQRIVQLRVATGVYRNMYPVRQTNIRIPSPEGAIQTIYNEPTGDENYFESSASAFRVQPERITVATYGNANWSYEVTEYGATNITVYNNPNNNNQVRWDGAVDEFIVTFVYPENTEISGVTFNPEADMVFFDENVPAVGVANLWTVYADIDEFSNLTSFNAGITSREYKGRLNTGQDVYHNSMWSMGVSFAPAVDRLYMESGVNVLYAGQEALGTVNIEYVSSIISRRDFVRMFGQDGQIRIYNNGELRTVVTLDSFEDDNDNLVVSHMDNTTSLRVYTSEPVSQGRFDIRHERVLRANAISSNYLAEATHVQYNVVGNSNVYIRRNMTLANPVSVATLAMDRTILSTAATNQVNFTVTLRTNHPRYDLFTNPVFEIDMPGGVNNVNIRDVNMLSGNGLEIASVNVTANNTIRIETRGTQRSYGENTQIAIEADINTERLIPTRTGNVDLRFENNRENTSHRAANSVPVTLRTASGLILSNEVQNGNERTTIFGSNGNAGTLEMHTDEVTLTYSGAILNNTGERQYNVMVIGRLPFIGDGLGTTVNTTLTSIVDVNARVLYSSEEAPAIDDASAWSEEATSGTRTYMIIADYMNQGDILRFAYNVEVPANLNINQTIASTYFVGVGGNVNQRAGTVRLETHREIDLDLDVRATVPEGETVYSGQELTYIIEVTNNSDIVANNVEINFEQSGRTTLADDSQTSWVVNGLEPGDSVTKSVPVVVDEIDEDGIVDIIARTMVDSTYLPEGLVNVFALSGEDSDLRVNLVTWYDINFHGLRLDMAGLGY
ncbi:MAG: hypothetical protein FWC68_01930, partial [Oscillospiraceae bacterium]|nr:hypothetical protein [Oscillospiraceae bacterium]